ncbi:MAG: dockerin type I domain-containing protein [Candidatus Bathyarchaeia archaeon]
MLRKTWVAAYLLLCLPILACSVNRISAASTEVDLDPLVSTVKVGDMFSVNVNVTNVVNLTAWQLNIYYLNAVINCTNVAEGPFLKAGGGTYFGQNITNNYNSTYGRILAYSTLLGMTSANGGGVILTVTFNAVSEGSTALGLANTQLADEKVPPQQIPHQNFGGTVTVTEAGHDVTVTNVTSGKIFIGQGYSSNITVTIGNLGGYTETFNTTVYANQTIIDTPVNTTLTSGTFTTLTFTWNTTGFAYGNYTLSAFAWPVPGENSTADNNFTGGEISITIPGDINGDGTVNILDAIGLANSFLTNPSSANWNPNADINGDNVVDILDAIILANNFLQQYP